MNLCEGQKEKEPNECNSLAGFVCLHRLMCRSKMKFVSEHGNLSTVKTLIERLGV